MHLELQRGDGNLVQYGPAGPLWATGRLGGSRAVLQGDGNLVVYRADGSVAWASNTAGSRADRLVSQSDGNLVLYAGSRPVWASRTVLAVAPPPPPPVVTVAPIAPPAIPTPAAPPTTAAPVVTAPAPPITAAPTTPIPSPETTATVQSTTTTTSTTVAPPTTVARPPAPSTWAETLYFGVAHTFDAGPGRTSNGASYSGIISPSGAVVTVDCRRYDLAIAVSNNGGWWYHLVTPNGGQWTPASLYWNDPSGTALVDPVVPVC
jgi:hypothetical protein